MPWANLALSPWRATKGALVLAQSLRNTGTSIPICVAVLPESVSTASVARLQTLFDRVITVQPIAGPSAAGLELIGRPDLHATLAKLNMWSLHREGLTRVLYLDADTLVLANLDHLFTLLPQLAGAADDGGPAMAASTELGFPDCFNSGVMLLAPGEKVFEELLDFAAREPSFDGGDQGVLNMFFGDGTLGHPMKADLLAAGGEATKQTSRTWYRLSYTYNMEMHKVYRMYIPAVLRYRAEHKVLHFIGKEKPWHFEGGKVERPDDAPAYFDFYVDMVGKWWDVRRQLVA